MAVRIFDDPTNSRKSSGGINVVGSARSGRQLNDRPVNLETWRFTTGDPEVAAALAEALGAIEGPQEWDTRTDQKLEVITSADSLRVIIDDPAHARSAFQMWSNKGKLIRECDGIKQKDGSDCVCPASLADRKKAAKEGTGCEPAIDILFRLADLPDLGQFRLRSGSWILLEDMAKYEPQIAEAHDEASDGVSVHINKVQVTSKDGDRTYGLIKLVDIEPFSAD